eukprot:gene7573-5340_t
MLQRSLRWCTKRTPGYVFWRERILNDLEGTKPSYLHTERPVPIAEVARRMAAVKAKYRDTQDFHERTLLRGEYKYYTGKPCDLRASQTADLVVFLEAAAFFGFWDVSQVDGIVAELYRRSLTESLDPDEVIHLLVCLPQLRKEASDLYRQLSSLALASVGDLTVEECATLCVASTAYTPDDLLLGMVGTLEPAVRSLDPPVMVELLDTLSTLRRSDPRRPQQLHSIRVLLQEHLVQALDSLTPLELAVTYASLVADADVDALSGSSVLQPSVHRKVMDCFAGQVGQACPRSIGIFFTALGVPLLQAQDQSRRRAEGPAGALPVAVGNTLRAVHLLGPRVVFLSVDFSPEELIPVLRVLLHAVVGLQIQTQTKVLPCNTARRQEVVRVVRELSQQLVLDLQEAAGFFSAAQLLAVIRAYDGGLVALADAAPCSSPGDAPQRLVQAQRQLVEWVPETRRVWELLSRKAVAACPEWTPQELLDLLRVPVLDDAALFSVLKELSRRQLRPKGAGPGAAVMSPSGEALVRDLEVLVGEGCPLRLRPRRAQLEELLSRWQPKARAGQNSSGAPSGQQERTSSG